MTYVVEVLIQLLNRPVGRLVRRPIENKELRWHAAFTIILGVCPLYFKELERGIFMVSSYHFLEIPSRDSRESRGVYGP